MKFVNCQYKELRNFCEGKILIPFGVGAMFENAKRVLLEDSVLAEKIVCAIDNGRFGEKVSLGDREIPVFSADKLYEIENAVIMICNAKYADEIYEQLMGMELSDTLVLMDYRIMLASSNGDVTPELEDVVFNGEREVINREIHTFWFSGDPIPVEYQRCVDSWKRYCPDYRINIWTQENYDVRKNPFMFKAIEQRKWAFAADWARLDVVYHQGGIYMDMDVELLKPLDKLLCNQAVFSFNMDNDIDLMFLASVKGNALLRELLDRYAGLEFDKERVFEFVQPCLLREAFQEFGVKMNGDMQVVGGNVFLPRNYLSPMDWVFFDDGVRDDKTIAIHRFNAGWQDNDDRMEQAGKMKALRAKMLQ